MAKGDVQYGRSRGGGYGGSYDYYDDEGRGDSKEIFEQFQEDWEDAGFDCSFLFDDERFPLEQLYRLAYKTTSRYGLEDFSDSLWDPEHSDGRTARLVRKKCSQEAWEKLLTQRVPQARVNKKDQEWFNQIANAIHAPIYDQQRQEEQEARDAQILTRIEEQSREFLQQAELTAGAIRSDFYEALRYREIYGQPEGDWLDDPVAAYRGYYGFGEEVKESVGVKLQITCSLDLSNSMIYNKISEKALEAFRSTCLALRQMATENEGDVFTAFFTFSDNEEYYDYRNRQNVVNRGKKAKRLSEPKLRKVDLWTDVEIPDECWLGEMEQFRDTHARSLFSGEDTWMYPLFEEIEQWENVESDPGAVRLDLVITDAVLEHPKDLRESDKIQERRDGALQTVVFNLMPEKDWHGGALPKRCIQYPANIDNLAGMLRNVISEFVSYYI